MTTYYVLYGIVLFIGILQHSTTKLFRNDNKAIILIFSLILTVIGLRASIMGNDLPGYIRSFKMCHYYSLKEMIVMRKETYEIGYICFIKFLSFFFENENVFLFISAACSIIPFIIVLCIYRVDSLLSALTFMAIPSFLMLFSGLRQVIAFGICFVSILFIEKKRLIPFVMIVAFASLFHASAFVFLVAYPVYNIRIDNIKRLISIGIIVVIYILKVPILTIAARFVENEYMHVDETGALGMLLFLIFNYIIAIFFSKTEDTQLQGYMNILYIGIVCQVFASVNNMAMRVSEYFMLILVLLIPKIVINLEKETSNHVILYLGYVIMLGFMGLVFLYQGGNSWTRSYPYYWFWSTN